MSWVSAESNENKKFISGSQDQSIIVWEWDAKADKVVKTSKCIGHTESVESVDVNKEKTKVRCVCQETFLERVKRY